MAGPLDGIRVLDLSRLLPGPFCTMIMADLGAEVVKIEDPVQGDYIRWLPPYADGLSAGFLSLNRNKKSAILNLKEKRGREIFLELIKLYDVVVEGFRPGVMEKLGVGYQTASEINPKIIYCSLTGYGQDGPYSDRAGHDINYIGYTGVLSLTGQRNEKPVPPGIQIGDMCGSLSAMIGIMAIIIERNRTGRGRHVDISLSDAAFAMLPLALAGSECGEKQLRGENTLTGGNPCYNTYETSDGEYICIGAIEPKFFKKFCALTGREDLEVFHHGTGNDRDHLEKELTDLFKSRTRSEWLNLLEPGDVCAGPVNTLEQALQDPHIIARQMVFDVPTGKGRSIRQSGLPFKLMNTQPELPQAPPEYGEHTAEVFAQIGITNEQLAGLRASGVTK
jgi:crotonobetainyl-CoA:carnitine CoA-transferase CaiB-like acyl-CoA transferase